MSSHYLLIMVSINKNSKNMQLCPVFADTVTYSLTRLTFILIKQTIIPCCLLVSSSSSSSLIICCIF